MLFLSTNLNPSTSSPTSPACVLVSLPMTVLVVHVVVVQVLLVTVVHVAMTVPVTVVPGALVRPGVVSLGGVVLARVVLHGNFSLVLLLVLAKEVVVVVVVYTRIGVVSDVIVTLVNSPVCILKVNSPPRSGCNARVVVKVWNKFNSSTLRR